MLEFLEAADSMRSDEASRQRLTGGDGIGASKIQVLNEKNPKYKMALVEAATFMGEVFNGRRRAHELTEALAGTRTVLTETHSTDDFKILFSDIIDRQVL